MNVDSSGSEQAHRDLEWLRTVGAVRTFEPDEEGQFVVELVTRQLLAIGADQVRVLRAGVLCGWRLPRAPGVIA